MTKPLAKSLHTVTVLKRLALHALEWNFVDDETPERAVDFACNLLGYADADDPYNLRGAAVEAVRKAIPAPTAAPTAAPVREPTPAELQAEWDDMVAREEREADRCIDVSFK